MVQLPAPDPETGRAGHRVARRMTASWSNRVVVNGDVVCWRRGQTTTDSTPRAVWTPSRASDTRRDTARRYFLR